MFPEVGPRIWISFEGWSDGGRWMYVVYVESGLRRKDFEGTIRRREAECFASYLITAFAFDKPRPPI